MKAEQPTARDADRWLWTRDSWVILGAIATIAAVAWIYMIHEAGQVTPEGFYKCCGLKLAGPEPDSWGPGSIVPLFLMWTEMMIAMMLPAVTPSLLIFGSVHQRRREQGNGYVPVAIFAAGYFAVWTGLSFVFAVAQWKLHATALLSPAMVGTSHQLGGALLVGAGVFQWTPLKHACLRHCRSPLGFLLAHWREGRLGAFWMGFKHGAYCIACCWLIMALLFVTGVMNILWIAVLSIFVLAERLAPQRWRIPTISGAILVVWGLAVWSGRSPLS